MVDVNRNRRYDIRPCISSGRGEGGGEKEEGAVCVSMHGRVGAYRKKSGEKERGNEEGQMELEYSLRGLSERDVEGNTKDNRKEGLWRAKEGVHWREGILKESEEGKGETERERQGWNTI